MSAPVFTIRREGGRFYLSSPALPAEREFSTREQAWSAAMRLRGQP